MMKHLLFFAGLVLSLQIAFCQKMSVSAAVDKQSIVIGEQVSLELEATIPRGKEVHFFQIDSLPHFEVLHKSEVDSVISDNGIKLQQKLTLTSWDSGHWQIPALAMAGIKTKPLGIKVSFSPLDPNQPYHEIKDIIDVRVPQESN